MIYICEKCGFLFERMGQPDSCPSCSKEMIRLANVLEKDRYKRIKEERSI